MIIIVLTAEYPEISKHVDGIAHQVTGKPYLTHISVTNSNLFGLPQSTTSFIVRELIHNPDGEIGLLEFKATNMCKTYQTLSEFYAEADELYEAHKLVLLKKNLGVS